MRVPKNTEILLTDAPSPRFLLVVDVMDGDVTLSKEGAELFLLSTDDSWFDSSFGKSLHFRHAVLRAVENGRTVVRTGNTGQSGIIDAKGNARDLLPLDTETYGIATVSLSEGKTLYTHIGDVTPYLSLGFLILVPLLSRKRKNETTKG